MYRHSRAVLASAAVYGVLAFAQVAPPANRGPRLRAPSLAERTAILGALNALTEAANRRDAAAVQAVTASGFYAFGESWLFGRNGYPRFAERRDDLTGVQIATLTREVTLLTDDVAQTGGFFRTLHMPGAELAGDFHCTLIRLESKWLVASVRFAPSRFDPPYRFFAQPHPSSRPVGEWITLFNGTSLDAFTSMDGSPASREVWSMEEGSILRLTPKPGKGQGLRTRDTFRSFELEWEWKLGPAGNSGLKYRNYYLTGADAGGHEYQMVDNEGDPGAKRNPLERAAALYEQIAASKDAARPIGEFNQSRVIVEGRHAEHWLNGEKVVEYDFNSDPFDSPILIQYHGQSAWFRNIRIRRLD